MRRANRTLILALMLLAAACGGGTEPEMKITSMPEAKVFLDGEEIGSTPLTWSVAPGSHTLAFEADGFVRDERTVEVTEGGKTAIEVSLKIADPASEEALARLAEILDLGVAPPDGEIELHRGGARGGITLYWPKADIRKEGLSTYRIDVDEEYLGDGFLVFRKGNRELYREAFDPDHMVTLERLPKEVVETADVGDTITWGIVYEERKRPVTAKFKVIRDTKAGRRLAKLEESQFFQKQDRLSREMLKADVLRDSGLDSKAITHYLAIARTWPSSNLPYRGLVTSARRLDLKDTPLYAEGARFATGRSRLSPRGISVGGSLGREPSQLPVALAAPRLEDIGAEPVASAGDGPGGSDTASAGGGSDTAGAGSGSAVAVAATAAAGHLNSQAEEGTRMAREAEERARGLAEGAKETRAAEERMMSAEQARERARGEAEVAREAARNAMQALDDARQSGDEEGMAEARKELDRALKDLSDAENAQMEAERAAQRAQEAAMEARESAGGMSAEDAEAAAVAARAEAERLRQLAEDARVRAEALAGAAGGAAAGGPDPAPGSEPLPEGLRGAADLMRDEAERLNQRAMDRKLAADDVENTARERREAEAEARQAERGVEKARKRVQDLMKLMKDNQGTGIHDEAAAALGSALDDLEKAERGLNDAQDRAQGARDQESEARQNAEGQSPEELRKEAERLSEKAERAREMSEKAAKAAEEEERGK